jgi:hypothetical protein
MPNKTIYVRAGDMRLWEDTEELAEHTGRSVSELIAEGLRLVHDKRTAAGRKSLPTTPLPVSAVTSTPRQPVPNPFAARD